MKLRRKEGRLMDKKFVLGIAAAILLAGSIIAWLMLGGSAPSNIDLGRGIKVDIGASMKNTVISREKEGKKLWEFNVGEMEADRSQQNARLKNIKGKIYRADGSYIDVKADSGSAVLDKNDFSLEGNVFAVVNTGEELKAEKVRYIQREELLQAEGRVVIKASGYVAEADKAETTTAFEKLKLKGNAKVEKGGN